MTKRLIPIYMIQLVFFLSVGALSVKQISERAAFMAVTEVYFDMEPKQLSEVKI